MGVTDAIYSTATNTCPRCHRGKVFTENNPYKLGSVFKMEKSCSSCGQVYEKETGFFYGAMYVSYGITAGWFILWFALQNLFLHWEMWTILTVVISWTVLVAPLTLRWSRMLWLNFFVKYDREVAENYKAGE